MAGVKGGYVIDLRSDTVTLPTEEMLEAIRGASLGDDVYREDPTVNRLEEMAAKKMGKEAALLVPSGTMANLVSLMSNARRGDCVILEAESHIYWYEVGGISTIAGLMPWPIRGYMGALDPKDVEAAIRPRDIHFPETTLVCIENTHNRAGGTIITPRQIEALSKVTRENGLKLYMDGARIFNAAVALKVDVREFTRHVDNLMFSLSKGLCCPVGSVIVGDSDFIERARKIRKMLGGGMRKAGIIAAPGIIALEKMIDRLEEDHVNAKLLANGIKGIEGLYVDLRRIQTNIVLVDLSGLGVNSNIFIAMLRERGLLVSSHSKNVIRMVTHFGIRREHIEKALAIIEETVRELRKRSKS
ncbi:MAG: low-specificity L-threonine aldolase [Candidatus Bathyarchaeia archaeon]